MTKLYLAPQTVPEAEKPSGSVFEWGSGKRSTAIIAVTAVTFAAAGAAAAFAIASAVSDIDAPPAATADVNTELTRIASLTATGGLLPAAPDESAQDKPADQPEPVEKQAETTAPAELAPDRVAAAEPAPLGKDNPRWSGASPVKRNAPPVIIEGATADNPAAKALQAFAQPQGGGAIPIAENEADVVALEEAMIDSVKVEQTAPVVTEKRKATSVVAPVGSTPVRAKTTADVRMRAGKNNGSAVLTVVPKNAAIKVADDCKGWCLSEYDGKRGYIYRKFINLPSSTNTKAVSVRKEATSTSHAATSAAVEETPKFSWEQRRSGR